MSQLQQKCRDAEPTPAHHFLVQLDREGRLLRSYTQNIDGLEKRAGLSCNSEGVEHPRNVQLHGDIHHVRCSHSSHQFAWSTEHSEAFNKGEAPDCPDCIAYSEFWSAKHCSKIATFHSSRSSSQRDAKAVVGKTSSSDHFIWRAIDERGRNYDDKGLCDKARYARHHGYFTQGRRDEEASARFCVPCPPGATTRDGGTDQPHTSAPPGEHFH